MYNNGVMRKTGFNTGEYYHLYNRGNNKQKIFLDKRDWVRFLFLILYFQSPVTTSFNNIGRPVSFFIKNLSFNVSQKVIDKILENKHAKLIAFALMENHFHLIIKENKKDGISQYMQRVLNSYTKYFNAKYGNTGHLFQGPFKGVHIKDNEQLLHLSAYIHRNPREIKEWKNREEEYFWSSYQDYIKKNRWNGLLENQIIMEQFTGSDEYKDFIETSGTKLKLDDDLKC